MQLRRLYSADRVRLLAAVLACVCVADGRMTASTSQLDSLEGLLVSSVQILNAIDQFTVPTEQPQNEGLGKQMCAGTSERGSTRLYSYCQQQHARSSLSGRNLLEDHLRHLHAASTDLRVEVPTELVHEYVDEGRPPDKFVLKRHSHMLGLSEEMQRKQHAFLCTAGAIRERAGELGLLEDDDIVKRQT